MADLIRGGLDLGWPALALLAGLLVYFQLTTSDPALKRQRVFKTFIGMIALFMLLIAVATFSQTLVSCPFPSYW